MYEIQKDGKILARHIKADDIKAGLNFFSKDEEYVQVGVWGNYEKGKQLNAHIHNIAPRTINRTQEVVCVMSGAICADIFDLEENFVEQLTVCQGEILVLLESGHGYTVLESGTNVLEVKNGPYLGAEVDRRRF